MIQPKQDLIHEGYVQQDVQIGGHTIKATYLDNAFWIISAAAAKALCGSLPLPKDGSLRDFDDYNVQSTVVNGEDRWSFMDKT